MGRPKSTKNKQSRSLVPKYKRPYELERIRAQILRHRANPVRILLEIAHGDPCLTTEVTQDGTVREIMVRPTVREVTEAARVLLDRVLPVLKSVDITQEQLFTHDVTRISSAQLFAALTGAGVTLDQLAQADADGAVTADFTLQPQATPEAQEEESHDR